MIWKEIRENAYCEITPAIMALKEQWEKENYIDPQLYKDYNVKRGLRNEDGRGVLTGLTRVAEIQSYTVTEDEHIRPADGVLYYRGIDCREVVRGSESRGRYAFEETAYLLLFGQLPDQAQLDAFCDQLASYRTLPTNFFRDIIMKAPPQDLMNTMQRAVLTLACYDDKPNDIGLENVLRQSLQLLSNMPVLAIYAYQAWRYSQGESLFTPLQLANYIATFVNGGTRRNVHLLKDVRSNDGSTLLMTYDEPPAEIIEMSDETFYAVKKGMGDLVTSGSVARYFRDCVVTAGAKTGSVQVGTAQANGTFVAFAPFEDPEIAVAVVIEQGRSGSALASTAVEILNCYFAPGDVGAFTVPEGALLH